MVEYTDGQGITFELPKLTTKLMAEMSKVTQSGDIVETVKAKYGFVKLCLPAEYLKERLDGSKIDDIDLVELAKVYSDVANAYSAPMFDANTQGVNEQLDRIKPMVDVAQSMASVAAANKNTRQVFKAI